VQAELPLLKERGFAAAIGNDVAISSAGRGHYPKCTVRSSITDERVAPVETKSTPKEAEDFKKGCSGRDLNPGSATRKAAMLDRTVQPY
jgi:hypothetical protein